MADLILGTANLEALYGFCGDSTLAISDFELILERFNKEISRIDSAVAYSGSHRYLTTNKINQNKFAITTKISAQRFFDSGLIELKAIDDLSNLWNFELLVHDGPELFSRSSCDIDIFFSVIRSKFPKATLGLSVQTENDMRVAIELDWIETIQIPINICDHRWLKLVEEFKDKKPNGVIRGRSVFLQGMLLRKIHNSLPYQIDIIRERLLIIKLFWREKLGRILRRDVTDIELAMLPLLSLKWLDGIIVGVNSFSQCDEIVKTFAFFQKLNVKSIEEIRCSWIDFPFKLPEDVLNPAMWRPSVI